MRGTGPARPAPVCILERPRFTRVLVLDRSQAGWAPEHFRGDSARNEPALTRASAPRFPPATFSSCCPRSLSSSEGRTLVRRRCRDAVVHGPQKDAHQTRPGQSRLGAIREAVTDPPLDRGPAVSEAQRDTRDRGVRVESLRIPKPFRGRQPFPPAPRPRPKIAPPGGQSQAPWRGMTSRRCSQSGEPSRTLSSVRRKPDAGGSGNGGGRQTAARSPDPSGRGNSENECLVRLLFPSRGRARRRRRWRRDVEPEPLEQDTQALAPRGHPNDPSAAAAARALKDVDGDDPAQKRRPRQPPGLRSRP